MLGNWTALRYSIWSCTYPILTKIPNNQTSQFLFYFNQFKLNPKTSVKFGRNFWNQTNRKRNKNCLVPREFRRLGLVVVVVSVSTNSVSRQEIIRRFERDFIWFGDLIIHWPYGFFAFFPIWIKPAEIGTLFLSSTSLNLQSQLLIALGTYDMKLVNHNFTYVIMLKSRVYV